MSIDLSIYPSPTYPSIYLAYSEKDGGEWILAAAALNHNSNKMVFFRQAIFLHFAYRRRPRVEDCVAFSDLSSKENIHITQKREEVVKQQYPPLGITQFIITHTPALLCDL